MQDHHSLALILAATSLAFGTHEAYAARGLAGVLVALLLFAAFGVSLVVVLRAPRAEATRG